MLFSPLMLVHRIKLYSTLARTVVGVLCLLCAEHVVSAFSRPTETHVDQFALALNTQPDTPQAGQVKFPTQKTPNSSTPHFLEVAFVHNVKRLSCKSQLGPHAVAETVQAFELDDVADQQPCTLGVRSSYSVIIVSDSSGRSPPPQS